MRITVIRANKVQNKNFQKFIDLMEKKAPRRKPTRLYNKKMTGTTFAIRNKRIAIREGALRRVAVIITYKKITTGEVKKYFINPYSYRTKKLSVGYRKVLFAHDRKDERGRRGIKNFVLKNIKNVALTDSRYVPKWKVEF